MPDFSVVTFDLGERGPDGRWRSHFPLKAWDGSGATWVEKLNLDSRGTDGLIGQIGGGNFAVKCAGAKRFNNGAMLIFDALV